MSTTPKKKKAPPVKLVRRQVPENAIMWVPGTELPDQIQQLVDRKIEAWATEYDQVHAGRLKNYRGPAPTDVDGAVAGMFYQLSGLNAMTALDAVGIFIQDLRDRKEKNLDLGHRAVELANETYESTIEQHGKLDKILKGQIQLLRPGKTFEPGAKMNTDMNLKKAPDGEAVVNKRATN